MTNLIAVNNDGKKQTVSGRDLHKFLEIKTDYSDWVKRMCEYGFVENIDYIILKNEEAILKGLTARTNHQISLPMAKRRIICQI